MNPDDLMEDNSPLGGDPILTSSSPIFHAQTLVNNTHPVMDYDDADMMS